MMDSADVEANAAGTPRPVLRNVLVLVGEIFSALAAFGFLASVAINALVFDRWGLNFLQVATTSDVIGSGIQLLVPSMALALGIWGGLSAAQVSPPRFWFVAVVLDAVLLAWIVAMILSLEADIPPPTLFGMGLGSAFFLGLMKQDNPVAPWPVPPNDAAWVALSGKKSRGGGVVLYTLVPLLLASLLLWAVVSNGVVLVLRDGYSPTVQTLSTPLLEPGCIGRVLWLGERGAVIRCEASTAAPVRVVRLEDSAIITVGRRIGRKPVGLECSVHLTAECAAPTWFESLRRSSPGHPASRAGVVPPR